MVDRRRLDLGPLRPVGYVSPDVYPMPPPPPRSPQIRVTLRGVTIFVVYLAAISEAFLVACWAFVSAQGAVDKFQVVFLVAFSTTILLFIMTGLLLRPGPGRDITVVAHGILGGLSLLALSLAPLVTIWYIVAFRPELIPGLRKLITVGELSRGKCVVFLLGPLFMALLLVSVLIHNFPRKCPACRWWTLVRSLNSPVTHRWCLACGARCKQKNLRTIAWEDASDPDEDRYYYPGM